MFWIDLIIDEILNPKKFFPGSPGHTVRKKEGTKRGFDETQDPHDDDDEEETWKRSNYVGVTWDKQAKKWKAQITIDGNHNHLGYFVDEKEAARKYDEQAALLNKPIANFHSAQGAGAGSEACAGRKRSQEKASLKGIPANVSLTGRRFYSEAHLKICGEIAGTSSI